MTATVIDSTVFRHIFSSEPMRQVFSDEHRVQCYLDVIDMAKLKSQTKLLGYPVLPVVQQLVAACADHLGEYCHWGATTQDITDTATILQLQEALVLIEDDVTAIFGLRPSRW